MFVLKVAGLEWKNENRDKRELSICRELGMDVAVLAKGKPGDYLRKDEVDAFTVFRASTRPLGTASCLNALNRTASIFLWAHMIQKLHPDIISGHDITGLLIGYISNLGRRKKAKLVYDSHEFELGRNAERGKLTVWIICHLERFLIKRSAFSIMVNDAIADEVQKIHGLEKRPIVVRNIPPYWELNAEKTRQAKKELLSDIEEVPQNTMILLYHGAILPERGIENMLRTVARLPYAAGVVLGNAQSGTYLDSLKDLCEELDISNRVNFHSAVSVDVLRDYVSAADVGIVTVLPRFKSYYYMLPNKFFECIQSQTPVIVSDFPAVGQIVDQYKIGLKVNPENVDEIAAAVDRMRTDRSFYQTCKENLLKAKQELCWENEKEVLLEAYKEVSECC